MEDRVPLLERPGEVKDDDFDPVDETVESHQDFDLETIKTSLDLGKLKEQEHNERLNKLAKEREEILKRRKEREEREEFEMAPKTSTGRETLRPKKFKEGESQWGSVKTPQLEKNISKAIKKVLKNFPDLDPTELSEFHVNINDEKITIKGNWSNAITHILFNDDGYMNEEIPEKLKILLGEQIEIKGLKEQLVIEKNKKNKYKKSKKKMEELIKTKDDEIKEKETEKDSKILSMKQMSDREKEVAKKEIEELTIDLNEERDKKKKLWKD